MQEDRSAMGRRVQVTGQQLAQAAERQQGPADRIARRLVEAACTFLEGLGCPKAELMVRDDNPAASLYPHLGWEPQGVGVWGRWLAQGAGV